ncbi:MAG: YcaO-like family protein [Candidatus Aenigmarchaeota archaeon]|nr:YcaO-like family protein [Candidatus Aenigmarchaeota archaeon]
MKPIVLKKCLKKYTYDTDKAETPKDTIGRVTRVLKGQGLNIVFEKLENRANIPVYRVVSADPSKDYSSLVFSGKAHGKGATESQAKCSALMEWVERVNAGNAIRLLAKDKETIFRAHETIPSESTIDIKYMLSYSHNPSFYGKSAERIIKRKKMHFMKAYCLTDKRERYLPFLWHLYFNGSNGLASGNTYEEAVLQALCEVIERHNIVEIKTLNSKVNAIELGFPCKPLAEMLSKIQEVTARPIIQKWSRPIPVPTVACRLHDSTGYGTAPSPAKAAMRAITEAIQEDTATRRYGQDSATIKIESQEPIPLSSMESLEREDLYDEINEISRILESMGHMIYVMDFSSIVPIPTVEVIVPGLRSVDYTGRDRHLREFQSCLIEYFNLVASLPQWNILTA